MKPAGTATASAFTCDYLSFLSDSPSSYHAADLVAQRLEDAGCVRQRETDTWDTAPGGHVVVRDGAVIAYVIPESVTDSSAFRIVGAHTDSPALVLKPSVQATTADGWGQLCAEIYGGMLLNSWLDRELKIAGRILTQGGEQRLVATGPLARIPQLAIHLDRTVSDKGLVLDKQQHMKPVWTVDEDDASVLDLVAHTVDLDDADQIASFDLILTPSQGPAVFGSHGQFVAAGRQDNLSSVHSGLTAIERLLADGISGNDVLIFACFDHEEVGSSTSSGAAGPFLEDILRRTAASLGRDFDGTARMMAASSCISADAGHSVHPNYADRHDPDNRPVMGRGPLLKLNANRRYSSDAPGIALWKRAVQAADAPWQNFVSNNAMPCGTTIGPITATRLGICTVDVGIGLLSMHSAREMSHVADLESLSAILEAYWRGA